jgi:hypothetical protein
LCCQDSAFVRNNCGVPACGVNRQMFGFPCAGCPTGHLAFSRDCWCS